MIKKFKKRKKTVRVKPIPPGEITVAKLEAASTDVLKVTAVALGNDLKKNRVPEQREAIGRIILFIRSIIEQRVTNGNADTGTNTSA